MFEADAMIGLAPAVSLYSMSGRADVDKQLPKGLLKSNWVPFSPEEARLRISSET